MISNEAFCEKNIYCAHTVATKFHTWSVYKLAFCWLKASSICWMFFRQKVLVLPKSHCPLTQTLDPLALFRICSSLTSSALGLSAWIQNTLLTWTFLTRCSTIYIDWLIQHFLSSQCTKPQCLFPTTLSHKVHLLQTMKAELVDGSGVLMHPHLLVWKPD